MKNLFLTAIFSLITIVSFSQTNTQKIIVDGVNINDKEGVEYIELLFFQKFLSLKVRCVVDYGQELEMASDTRVQSEDGTVMTFNSVINGFNYFVNNGWEFVSTYPVTMGNVNVYHYLLRRKK